MGRASACPTTPHMAYTTADELARVIPLRNPTTEQQAALERVVDVAAAEIDAEIDMGADSDALTTAELAIAEQVNLDRAQDLWHHTESTGGITGLLGDDGTISQPSRYSWRRYAERLAPLKRQWGIG